MKKCSGTASKHLLVLNKINQTDTLNDIIKQNNEKFINFLFSLGIYMQDYSTFSTHSYETYTTITSKTRCFKVDFNDTFVTIIPLDNHTVE